MSIYVPGKLTLRKEFTWNETVWNPSMVGPALWLDAADASTITESGGAVSQWDDKSGNNHHVIQAASAAQPTYSATGFNSLPTVFFDGISTNDEMACATTTVSSQGDLFYGAVFQMLSNFGNWRLIVGTQISSTTNNIGTLLLQRMDTRSEIGIHESGRRDTGSTYAVQVTNISDPRIATVGRSGGSDGNGGLITVTATGPSQPTYLTQAVQSWTTSEVTTRIQIGGRQQSGTAWSNSNISEVVVCNRNLTTVERQKLEGYFAHKWGLTDYLPAGHPYKLVGPTP
jgi:hypothetical protein